VAEWKEGDPKREAILSEARKAQRMAAMEARLPDFLRAGVESTGKATRMEMAEICRRTKRYATATRLYRNLLLDEPGLHVSAIRSAALAAAGIGADSVAGEDRSEFHTLARKWLLENPGFDRRNDPALAAVRHPESLAKFPAKEREAWLGIWGQK
jgi:hypothetical protein